MDTPEKLLRTFVKVQEEYVKLLKKNMPVNEKTVVSTVKERVSESEKQ